ncbi:MAG: sigma-70 family RNA polymerase sigma factor [Terriglobales bacterium]
MGTIKWMHELSDSSSLPQLETLPEASQNGAWPEAGFEAVFRQQYAHIAGLITRLVGERAQAEEITGEAFWRLYRRPALAEPGNNVAGWLYRTAMRLGLDALRERKRNQAASGQLRAEAAGQQHGEDPLSGLESRERAALVRVALSRLKPAQAQILLLRHGGAPYLELAARLGMKPGSVGTTLTRAEAAFVAQWHKLQKELRRTK